MCLIRGEKPRSNCNSIIEFNLARWIRWQCGQFLSIAQIYKDEERIGDRQNVLLQIQIGKSSWVVTGLILQIYTTLLREGKKQRRQSLFINPSTLVSLGKTRKNTQKMLSTFPLIASEKTERYTNTNQQDRTNMHFFLYFPLSSASLFRIQTE